MKIRVVLLRPLSECSGTPYCESHPIKIKANFEKLGRKYEVVTEKL